MQVQYRFAGFHSPLGRVFLSELEEGDLLLFSEPLKQFESACLLATLEDALLVFPFRVEEVHLPKLERIHKYIRQIAIGQIAEELLFRSSTAAKDSLPAAQLMLESMIKGELSENDLSERLTVNVYKT